MMCPRCKKNVEILGHIMNLCLTNAGSMCTRHKYILNRVIMATKLEDSVNRFKEVKILDSPGDL